MVRKVCFVLSEDRCWPRLHIVQATCGASHVKINSKQMYNSNFFFQSIIRETVRDVFTKQTDFQNMTIYNKWNDTRWARKKILGCRWKSNPRPSVHWSDALTNGILRTHGWTGQLWADITSASRSLLSSRWGLNPRQYMDNIWGFFPPFNCTT